MIKIQKLKEKLYKTIDKYGLKSQKTYQKSVELDDAIVEFYQNKNKMQYLFEYSLEGIYQYISQNNCKPSKREWNRYAKVNHYLSSESMQYIYGDKFEYICSHPLAIKNNSLH